MAVVDEEKEESSTVNSITVNNFLAAAEIAGELHEIELQEHLGVRGGGVRRPNHNLVVEASKNETPPYGDDMGFVDSSGSIEQAKRLNELRNLDLTTFRPYADEEARGRNPKLQAANTGGSLEGTGDYEFAVDADFVQGSSSGGNKYKHVK